MSNFVISLLVALGVAGWIYYKFFSRRTGEGNTRPAIIGSVVVGVIIFVIVFLALSTFIKTR